ncbi:heat shock 70 kDa protein 16-like [Dioscorea cayenensis subsp. rotundata]|uniref:Heat shock 70 kDa protein 16-like n=1 Tax=Dioscorea cayennensis subsp. rotundata TaxID=55577 RepID=A0AB40CI42_DIOCR|nr:heat shock 70 kDa protein 16-like [Dioscorea cayenensis subsp. rotundata]
MNSPPRIAGDEMIAVGFDVGNGTCTISTVRQGVVDVLLIDEPALISFSDKQRFIGSSASSLLYPSSTFSDIKDLLLSQPRSQYRVWFLKKEITFTPVHLLGMLLSRLKLIAERSLGVPVSDCVISLPSYADQFGRGAYLQAFKIAGLKPLRLIHDTTATALGYGIYKTDFYNCEILVFVDVGHCGTQVSVVVFKSSGLRVLSHAADRRLGGRDFDEILFKHFSKQFEDEYQIDVSSNAKASIRLKAECEKVKKVLSANAEASMSIECLMDDKDVKGFIKREEFEKLASGLLDRLLLPCENALSDAGFVVDEVQSVELIGSASGIPAITRILSSFFGKEPSRTLDVRECVARGCALQCAMLACGVKIKNYQVHDLLPHSLRFELDSGWIRNNQVLLKGAFFPTVKVVNVPVRGGFSHLSASSIHTDENGQPLDGSQIIDTFFSCSLPLEVDSQVKGRPWSRLDRPIDMYFRGALDCSELVSAGLLEMQLADQDKLVERIKDRKNELQALVNEFSGNFLERYRRFATETERMAIFISVEQSQEVLCVEGVDLTENVYNSELLKLKKLLEPIVNRFKDEEARPQATRELVQCIVDNKLAVE